MRCVAASRARLKVEMPARLACMEYELSSSTTVEVRASPSKRLRAFPDRARHQQREEQRDRRPQREEDPLLDA